MTNDKQRLRAPFGIETDDTSISNAKTHDVASGGTTAERSATPPDRAWRVNTQTEAIEIFVNGRWVSMSGLDSISDMEDLSFFYAIIMGR